MKAQQARQAQVHTVRLVFRDEEDQHLYRLLAESAHRTDRPRVGMQIHYLLHILFGQRPLAMMRETGLRAWGAPQDADLYKDVDQLRKRMDRIKKDFPWMMKPRPVLRLVPKAGLPPDDAS
jgi:hypothetical protein